MKAYSCLGLMIIASLLVQGCSSGPSVIKGSVIMRTADGAHINLGSDDGIQLGDTLTVFHNETPIGGNSRSVRAGKVKVIKILDKNYSAVEVIEGTLDERDTVEKKNKYQKLSGSGSLQSWILQPLTCYINNSAGIRLGDHVAPKETFSTKYKINMFILCCCSPDELSATPDS